MVSLVNPINFSIKSYILSTLNLTIIFWLIGLSKIGYISSETTIKKEITIDLNDKQFNPSLPIFNPSTILEQLKLNLSTSIKYQLKHSTEGGKQIFTINQTTGSLFIKSFDYLDDKSNESLTIVREVNNQLNDVILLTIKFSNGQNNQLAKKKNGSNDDEANRDESMIRVKRAPPRKSNKEPVEQKLLFNLQMVKGDSDNCKPGDSLNYLVTINLPKGKENDLYIELFTRKPTNPNHVPILSLYNVTMFHDKKIVLPKSATEPQYHLSKTNANVYDRVIINLDGIENSGHNGNSLTIQFSAVMFYNEDVKPGSKHLVSVGAEFQGNRFVWVGQDQVTYDRVKTDPIISGTLTGPEELTLGSAAIYSFRTKMAFRSDILTVEATVPNTKWAPDNKVSLGQIGLGSMGFNWAALPKDFNHYEVERSLATSRASYYRSLIKLGTITSIAATAGNLEKNTDDDSNLFEFKIPVYGLNYEANNGSNANLTLRLVFGAKVRFSQTIGIKLISSNVSSTMTSQVKSWSPVTGLTGDYSPKSVNPGDLTSVLLNVTLGSTGTLTDLEVVLKDAGPGLSVDSCGARLLPGQSSPNIPYLNSSWFPPKNSGSKQTFIFEKINVVSLYPTLINNNIEIELALKINSDESIAGALISLDVYPSGQSYTSGQYYEANVTITPGKPDEGGLLKTSFDKVVPWKEIHSEGGIAFETELILPPTANYSNVDLKIREVDSPDSALEICRVTLTSIGNSLPCTKALEPVISSHVSTLSGNLTQDAIISFGDVCSKPAQTKAAITATKDRTISTFIAIKGTNGIESSSNRTLEVTWTGDPISGPWSQKMTIPIVIGAEIPTVASKLPKVLVTKTTPGSVGVGQPTTGSIMMLLATQSTIDYTVEVFPTQSDSNSSICSIWIKSVGHNMPCFDASPTTVLESKKLGHNTKGTLHLGVISNLGPLRETLPAEEEEEADKIRLMTMVTLSPTATSDERFDVVIKSGKHSERSAFIVPINRFPKPLKTKTDDFEIIDGTKDPLQVPIGGPAAVRMRVMVKPNSMAQPALIFPTSNFYNITDFEISWIGSNYPCYSPFSASKDISKGIFALGVIANSNLNKSSHANWIEVTAALQVSPSVKSSQSIKFEAILEIPGTEFRDRYDSKLIAVKNVDTIAPKTVWINESTIEEHLAVRETRWIKFNVTTEPDWRSRFTIDASGEIIEGRPVISVRGIRVSRLGRNLPTGLPATLNVTLDSVENRVTGIFDYTANFGFSHKVNATLDGDDNIEVQVLIQMMSHSIAFNGDEVRRNRVSLRFMVETTDGLQVLAQGDRFVKVIPGTSSVPLMNIKTGLSASRNTYGRGEQVSIRVSLSHTDVSKGEPLDSSVRVYLPNYLEFKSLIASSRPVTINQPINLTYFDVKVPVVLFWETVDIDLSLIVDPNKLIGYGRGDIPTTILITMYHQGTKLISKFKHISFTYKSEDCFSQIELNDCQIVSSTALNSTFGPTLSRLSISHSAWIPSPASSYDHDFIEYDLLGRTRITGIQLSYPMINQQIFSRKLTSFHLEISDDSIMWFKATSKLNVTNVQQSVNGLYEIRIGGNIETRYLRFIIDSLENSLTANHLLAIKIGLLGCRLPGPVDVCNKVNPKWTWFDDDNKHPVKQFVYAVDHYTLYGCHFRNDPNYTECFRSKNGGGSWTKLPSYVHSLVGYETLTGRVIAIDSSSPVKGSGQDGLGVGGKLIYTRDGIKWSPMSRKESTSLLIGSSPESLVPFKVIGQSWDKFTFTSVDIKHSGHTKLQWTSSCH